MFVRMGTGIHGGGVSHGWRHLPFCSSSHFLDRARDDCRSSTQALSSQFTASLFELQDADVDATGILVQITIVFAGLGMPALWQSESI